MKSLLHSLGLLLLLSVGSPLCLQAQSSLTAIGEMIEREQYDLAEQALLAVIEQEPKHARAYYWLGMIFLEREKYETAKSYFERGINARKREALNYAGLGRVLFARREIPLAEKKLQKALKRVRNNKVEVNLAVARIYLNEGSPRSRQEALVLLLHAQQLDPGNPESDIALGEYYFAQNSPDLALAQYQQAIDASPGEKKAYIKLAEVLARQEQFSAAHEALALVAAIDSTYPPMYRVAGLAYLDQRKYDSARVHLERYYFLTNGDRIARRFLGNALFLMKDVQGVVNLLLHQDSLSNLEYRLLGMAYEALGEMKLSKYYFDEYFKRVWIPEPQSIPRTSIYPWEDTTSIGGIEIYKMLGDEARQDENYDWEVHYRAKYIEKKQRASMEISLRDYYYLGTAQYYAGQFHEADSSFGQVIAIQPDFSVAHFWRVRIAQKFDPDHAQWLALPHAQRVVELLGDKAIGELKPAEKTQLGTCYQLMVAYHYAEQPDGTGNCEAALPWLAKARELGEKREWVQQIQTQCDL